MRKWDRCAAAGLVMMAWPALAFAQQDDSPSMSSQLLSVVPFALMFLVIYTLVMRPAQRQRKEQEDMHAALKRDDEVTTQGGLIGRITAVDEGTVTLEVGERERVKMRVLRAAITGLWDGKVKGAAR